MDESKIWRESDQDQAASHGGRHGHEPLDEEAMDKAVHGRDVDPAESEREFRVGHSMRTSATDPHAQHSVMRDDAHAGHSVSESAAGYEDHSNHVDHTGHEEMFRRRFWVSLALSIPVLLYSEMIQMWLGFTMPIFPGSDWIVPVLSVVIFAYGGLPFLRMALPELRNRQPGMMTLISLAITVAFVYSLAAQFVLQGETFFWELVTLIDIMLLGHWLEMRSVRQASGALDELAKLMPDVAERERGDGSIEEARVDQLREGDVVLVRPGASVPVDGLVERGESDVNEAMLTGESRPIKKRAGDRVIAGAINGDGSLRVRVTATGEQTALAGIMRLVRDAQTSKSRTQVLADRAAAWLFYIALAVALVTALAWTLATGFNVDVVARVATVLVIACPHALGLAIPLVVAITTAKGAKNGILVRDRLALEAARDIDTIIFDKTGTLTEGRFGVVSMASAANWTPERALGLAAAVEGDSEHTIAAGIRRAAEDRGLAQPAVTGFEALKGRGVSAQHDEQQYYVGGPRLVESLRAAVPPEIQAFEVAASNRGQTTVYLVEGEAVVAAFALADVIREESRSAVQRLREMGVEVAMLTGDAEAVAQSVAKELGIGQYFAQVLPEHKDQKVAELQRQGRKVAMVGDGVNDAPALTRADVGIAIGSGTDVAVQSAGIILVNSNPLDAVKVIELSRASYRKMVQNLVWATGYNVIALPLAAGVLAPVGILLSPAVGAVLMSVSTVVVAVNAQTLRALRFGT